MPFHTKILILSSKSLVKIHEFGHVLHVGRSILANLKDLIFKEYTPRPPKKTLDPRQKLKVPSFNSEAPALYKS